MISLYIPYFNNLSLLEAAWNSVRRVEGIRRVVIDNSKAGTLWRNGDRFIARTNIIRLSVSLHFGTTTHWMFSEAKRSGNSFWLVMHSDAAAGEGSVKQLIYSAEKAIEQERKWGVIFTNYDALAAYNTEAYEAVGGWDVNIPTYCGDTDLFRRLRLAGYETVETDIPCEHFGSGSIRSDEKTRFLNDITAAYAHDYYIKKWGALPPDETFTVPFDRPDLFS